MKTKILLAVTLIVAAAVVLWAQNSVSHAPELPNEVKEWERLAEQGLGRSSTSMCYGLDDADEAREYLNYPILGTRLRKITNILLELSINNAHEIFGSPDDMKLRSCMTLFDSIERDSIFQQVFDKFFDGRKDNRTLAILNHSNQNNIQ